MTWAVAYELLQAWLSIVGGEVRSEQSAIESCIAAAGGAGGGKAQEPWQRGVYSLRMGGSEFIEGKSPASEGDSVIPCVPPPPYV